MCVLGHGFAICSPDVEHHVIILNNPVGACRPATARLIVRNSYSLAKTCAPASAMLKSD